MMLELQGNCQSSQTILLDAAAKAVSDRCCDSGLKCYSMGQQFDLAKLFVTTFF